MKNLGILLSGRGSNFEAIAKNAASGKIPDAHIEVVISNRPDAAGLEIARRLGLTALVISSKGKEREEHDREVVAALKNIKSTWSASPDTCACSRPGLCSSSHAAFLIFIRLSCPPSQAWKLRSKRSLTG